LRRRNDDSQGVVDAIGMTTSNVLKEHDTLAGVLSMIANVTIVQI
jgi:hypothetical protein